MVKRIAFFLLLLLIIFPSFSPALAAKKLVRKTTAGAKVKAVSYSSVKLNRASHSAVVTFTNQSNVKSVEYTLSYTANGIPQGAMGSFTPGSGNTTRDLYFGTCSKGVCTPHYGITAATLTVKTIFTSGKTHTKRYRFARV